jgi:hypothetical protein
MIARISVQSNATESSKRQISEMIGEHKRKPMKKFNISHRTSLATQKVKQDQDLDSRDKRTKSNKEQE